MTAGGERGHARQPLQLPDLIRPAAPGVAPVHEQVEPGAEQPFHGGRVAQPGARGMGDGADPQPALERPQPLGEPRRLGLADETVVVLFAVAHRDRGVDPGDDRAQLGQFEQRPRLGAVEGRAVEALVELAE